ncbi:hypothetical protein VPH35_116111 [Triticum aestivum]
MAAAASICPVRASPATRWTPTDSPRLPLSFPPISFIRRRQKRRHHSILAPPDSGPVGLPPAAAATMSPCLHPPPAQPHTRGVQPRASGVCGFTGVARSHGSAANGVD